MTLGELLAWATREFRRRGFDNAAYEAREVLLGALRLDLNRLLVDGETRRSAADEAKIASWVEERARGVPLAYLTGRKGFYKHEFHVARGVLVPRPETELVVEAARRRHASRDGVIADLGAGTGCIGLSLLAEWPAARLIALDVSGAALDCVRENARALGLEARVSAVRSRVEDWAGEPLAVVVTNPPYIAERDPRVEPGVHAHEPHAALYSGADGLDAYRAWVPWASRRLRAGGLFVGEFGAGQTAAVGEIMEAHGFEALEVDRDLAGVERVISGVKAR